MTEAEYKAKRAKIVIVRNKAMKKWGTAWLRELDKADKALAKLKAEYKKGAGK